MPFFYLLYLFIFYAFNVCVYFVNMRRISMNYDEMREKQGANLLNHVATLVGQDQFCFFPLLLNNGYCVLRYCGDVKGPIFHNSWTLSVVFFI